MSDLDHEPASIGEGQIWRDGSGNEYLVVSATEGVVYRLQFVSGNEKPGWPLGSQMSIYEPSELLDDPSWRCVSGPSKASTVFDACKAGDVDRVRELLEGDAELANSTETGGIRPLHVAATEGHGAVVSLLLDNGADGDAKNDYGVTPLYLAAAWGHAEVVSLLLAAGADRAVTDEKGETAFAAATRNGHEEVVALLNGGGTDASPDAPPSAEAEPDAQEVEIAALVEKLGDADDPAGRQRAQQTLETIGEPAVGHLIQHGIRGSYDNSLRRWYAVVALGNIGSPAARAALRTALVDPDDDVKWEAQEALDKIGSGPATSTTRKRSWQFWRR